MDQLKLAAAQAVHGELPEGSGITVEALVSWMQETPKHVPGDFALPCFSLAKPFRKTPPLIAKNLADKVGAVANGPYLNFTS
jgi:arginyl-tRNA synthetase